jgi:hypothetical protein
MQIDTFAWASPIPRSLYMDRQFMYEAVIKEYGARLQEAGGFRIPGPVRVQVLQFGYIDDNSMEEVVVGSELSPHWTFAVVRVMGPATRP